MRKRAIAGLSLLSLLLLMLLGLAFLLATESGLQTVYILASRILPGELTIKSLQGRLLGPLEIRDLKFGDGHGMKLEFASLSLAWQPTELFQGMLHLNKLHIDQIKFASGPPAEDVATQLPDIRLPMAVQLDELRLSKIEVNNPGKAPPLLIDQVLLKAGFTADDELRIDQLKITSPLYQATLNGTLLPQGDYPLQLQLAWALTQQGYAQVSGAGSLQGTVKQQLVLSQNIGTPFQAELKATLSDVLNAPAWQLEVQLSEFDARELNADWPVARASGQITSSGNLADFTALGEIAALSPEFGALSAGFDVRSADGQIVLNSLNLSVPKTGALLTAKATLDTRAEPQAITASADWQALNWPLTGIAEFASSAGKLELSGTLDQYQLDLNAELAGLAIPAGSWKLRATGNKQSLLIDSLSGTTLEGVLKASGNLAWSPYPLWNLNVQGEGLNPAAHWPDWPGRISFQAHSVGSQDIEGVLRAEAQIENLSGSLRDYPVAANTLIKLHGENYSIPHLHFSSGSASFDVSGEAQQNWDLAWQLDVPDLHTVLAGGQGKLTSSGKLSGPRAQPRITAFLDADALVFQDKRLKRLLLQADIDPLGTTQSHLKLDGQGLQAGGLAVDNITVEGSGSPAKHQLTALLETPFENLDLGLQGSWVAEQWSGELSRLQLHTTGFGNWTLEQPTPLRASAVAAQLAQLCISGSGRLCLDGQWQQTGASSANVLLKDIPLALAQPFLPSQISALSGTLSADAAVQYPAAGALTGRALIDLSAGSLSYAAQDGKPLAIRYQAGQLLAATLDAQGARGDISLMLSDAGLIQGNINLPQLDALAINPATQKIAGQLQVKLDQLALLENFLPKLEKLQGLVEAKLDISGYLAQPVIAAAVDIQRVKGVASGQPVDLSGVLQARVDGENYSLSKLEINSGSASLTASGELQERWDLNYKLAAPKLNSVYPGLGGSLQVDGKLSGPRDAPMVSLKLNGKSLAWQDTKIATLEGNAELDLLGGSDSRLTFDLQDLLLGAQKVESIKLQGSGKPEQHQLTASLKTAEESLELALNGSVKAAAWVATLNRAKVTTKGFGDWNLANPVLLTASAEQASLGQLCLLGQGRLCAEGNWKNGANSTAALSLRDIPLGLAKPFLPEDLILKGTLQGSAKLNYSAAGAITGEALFELPSGSVSAPLEAGSSKRTVVAYQGGRLQLNADGQGARGELALSIVDAGQLQGSFSLPRFAVGKGDTAKQPLTGKLRARFDQLDLIATLVPALGKVTGLIEANLDLGGTLAAPSISGVAAFRDGAIDVTSAGIKVREIQVEAHSRGGQTLQLEGSARSGAGSIQLSGQLALDPAAGFPATIKITGERFQAVDLAEAKAIISPDLDIRKSAGRIDVTGEIIVPEVTIKELRAGSGGPDIVQVSDDVVIINTGKAVQPEKVAGLSIYAKVRIVLGDKVAIDAYGFKGKINGSILVEDDPGSAAPTGTGQLQIVEGTYKAYGQDLTINSGRILFNGGTVDNPGLDVSAVRSVDAITAGVRVRGTVKAPELTLFSTPAQDDANTLSYLLLGRPLNQLSGGEGNALFQAASSIGLKGGNALAQRIGSKFGLEEVGIESSASKSGSGSGLGGASLVLGKYLSPRLYVQYGVGLFNAGSVVRIRYKLTEHFSIQTETGKGSGADLLYSLER